MCTLWGIESARLDPPAHTDFKDVTRVLSVFHFQRKHYVLPKIEFCLRFLVPSEILLQKFAFQSLKQLPCVIFTSLGSHIRREVFTRRVQPLMED